LSNDSVEAIATRTRFYDTIITGTDFTDAVIDRYQVALMCERAEGNTARDWLKKVFTREM
jgi:hypothetical protein